MSVTKIAEQTSAACISGLGEAATYHRDGARECSVGPLERGHVARGIQGRAYGDEVRARRGAIAVRPTECCDEGNGIDDELRDGLVTGAENRT